MRYLSLAACLLIALMPGCKFSSEDQANDDSADNLRFDTCMRTCETSCPDNSMICSRRRHTCENNCAPNVGN